MTVRDLIDFLSTCNPDYPVAYRLYSEYCLLEVRDVEVMQLCEPRPDGWVHSERPDKPAIPYLVFPGN